MQAAANLQSALALAQESGLPGEAYSILGALGALYAQQGSQAQAQQSYKAAAAIIMPAALIVSDQPVCVVIPIITTGTAIKSR